MPPSGPRREFRHPWDQVFHPKRVLCPPCLTPDMLPVLSGLGFLIYRDNKQDCWEKEEAA